ncbi:MAG: zinc-binding dehydrogenase [Clostridia bacterium]
MKAWFLNSNKNLSQEDYTLENNAFTKPIKIKINRLGLCASDVSLFGSINTKFPCVLGRTAIGLISESVENSAYKLGQKVLLSPYKKNNKISGVNDFGFMCDYTIVEENQIYTLPDGITEKQAIFIEDIAYAIKTLTILDVDKTQYVLLVGASAINCIVAQLCLFYQAIPIVVDKNNDALKIASKCGVCYTINPNESNVAQKVLEITAGKLVDHCAFDADLYSSIDELLELVKPQGKVCLCGYSTDINKVIGDFSCIIKNQLTIFGNNNGKDVISSAINMLANKVVNVSNLIQAEVNADKLQETLVDMYGRANYFKTIVKMD